MSDKYIGFDDEKTHLRIACMEKIQVGEKCEIFYTTNLQVMDIPIEVILVEIKLIPDGEYFSKQLATIKIIADEVIKEIDPKRLIGIQPKFFCSICQKQLGFATDLYWFDGTWCSDNYLDTRKSTFKRLVKQGIISSISKKNSEVHRKVCVECSEKYL